MQITPVLLSGILLAATIALAQDDGSLLDKIQIHGNLAQGVLFSSSNNYLSAKSSDGSFQWTEGAISFGTSVMENLRIGLQLHSYSLGQIGKQKPTLDWAFGDYKLKPYFGIRVGKVKTPMGWFNDVQDIDAVHQWALLPQGVYEADMKSFNLAHNGFLAYGDVTPSKKIGTLSYQVYAGSRSQDRDEGFTMQMAAAGINLGDCSGPTKGLDVRWALPVKGVTLGTSYQRVHLSAPGATRGGSPLPINLKYSIWDFYGQYELGKLTLDAEWNIYPTHQYYGPAPDWYAPLRTWYAMASYRLTSKLALGAYYSNLWFYNYGNRDNSDPGNYQKDVVLNSLYDINSHFYFKLEGHYIHGLAGGFYSVVNPNGLEKDTKLLAARVGFTF